MPLSDWLANRWIVAHSPSVQEITDLFAVVDRDLMCPPDLEDLALRLAGTICAPYVA